MEADLEGDSLKNTAPEVLFNILKYYSYDLICLSSSSLNRNSFKRKKVYEPSLHEWILII